ncbi:MFS transporter [Xenorhabdus sp. PB30.3]|uniref:MFS transporter n=1 Tax=Xenorhabdus sp. PB30.3 TaxID=2788941 RepID=UPI001E2ADFD0|nr:MFS transporter [Xenorhabdus sp. PB30.3]MCC8380401.1 MFS transporter [Xenorhabdus sp. PB30.3]
MRGTQIPSSHTCDESKLNHTLLQFILILLSGLGPTSFQIFLPSVPSLVTYFGTTPATANLTVSLSMISFAIACLVYGRLADRLGRRTILLLGMAILILGSFICLSAQSIEAVILGRIIQPAGGAAGVIAARIIVMDIYHSEKAANVMSKLVASMMISPLLGVPLGGLLTDNFGWRSNFILIGAIAAIVFIIIFFSLPESRKAQTGAGKSNLFHDYRQLAKNATFLGNAFQFGFAQSAFMAFMAAAPIVLTQTFQLSASGASLLLLMVSGSTIIGNLSASRLPQSLSLRRRLLLGSIAGFIFSLVALTLSLVNVWSIPALVLPTMVFSIFYGITSPAAQAGAIGAIKPLAGTAAGLSMFISMLLASFATQFIAEFNSGTPLVITFSVALLAFLSLISAIITLKKPE